MATHTLGTSSTTVLPFAITWQPGGLLAADLATIRNHILNDIVLARSAVNQTWGGALENGKLFVPNRGFLQLVPGDIVAVGTKGWPILVSPGEATADWIFT